MKDHLLIEPFVKVYLALVLDLRNSAMDVRSNSKPKTKYLNNLQKTFLSCAFDNIDHIVKQLSRIEYQAKMKCRQKV